MVTVYLALNALLYAVFALWCAFRLESTSQSLGFVALNNSGRSEYLTIYGGLQWGLALIFLFFALKPELHRAGLVVAIALYLPLVIHRTLSLLRFSPVERLTQGVAVLEVALLVAAVALWFVSNPRTA